MYLTQPYNEKVDVYSFALILWEMISGEQAFAGMSKEEHRVEVILGGQRPPLGPIRARAPVEVARLLERCWDGDHMRRPAFASILRELSCCCSDHEQEEAECSSTPPSSPSSHHHELSAIEMKGVDMDMVVGVSGSKKTSRLIALLWNWRNIFFSRRSAVYCLEDGSSAPGQHQEGGNNNKTIHPMQELKAKAVPAPTTTTATTTTTITTTTLSQAQAQAAQSVY